MQHYKQSVRCVVRRCLCFGQADTCPHAAGKRAWSLAAPEAAAYAAAIHCVCVYDTPHRPPSWLRRRAGATCGRGRPFVPAVGLRGGGGGRGAPRGRWRCSCERRSGRADAIRLLQAHTLSGPRLAVRAQRVGLQVTSRCKQCLHAGQLARCRGCARTDCRGHQGPAIHLYVLPLSCLLASQLATPQWLGGGACGRGVLAGADSGAAAGRRRLTSNPV